MEVQARTEDRALLEKLVTVAERACIVANTLRAFGPALGRRLTAGQRTLDPPVVVRVHPPQPSFFHKVFAGSPIKCARGGLL